LDGRGPGEGARWRGRSSGGTTMVADGRMADSAGERVGRAWGRGRGGVG
jgi:hypothetical protein